MATWAESVNKTLTSPLQRAHNLPDAAHALDDPLSRQSRLLGDGQRAFITPGPPAKSASLDSASLDSASLDPASLDPASLDKAAQVALWLGDLSFSGESVMARSMPTYADVVAARARIGELACRTPLIEHPALNAIAGGRVLLKAENLQRVGAFKF